MHNELLSRLNNAQKEAVQYFDSPLMVVAGAGSGKTRIITYKIAYLCLFKKVSPANILALTFTNKAANEMKERVEKLVNLPAHKFNITTFHSLGAVILRENGSHLGFSRNWQIIDENEQSSILKKICSELNLSIRNIQYLINNAKINLLFVQDREKLIESGFSAEELRVFEHYSAYLQKNMLWDFEDLISYSYLLLKNFPEVCNSYSKRFAFILVDEYQDTNPNQYQLLKLLAGNCRQITVVGDDDQAIYSWRGARIEYLLNFEKDFPQTKIIKLEQNYRTTASIIKLANLVISENLKRHPKTMWTENESGWPPFFISTASQESEAEEITSFIKRLKVSRPELFPVAILMRTNSQTLQFEKKFTENNLDFKILRGIGFFQRKEIKDLLSLLFFVNNPELDIYFKRAIQNFPLGIGEKKLSALENESAKNGCSLFAAYQTLSASAKQNETMQKLLSLKEKNATFSQQLTEIIEITDFYKKMSEHQDWERWENVLTLIEYIKNWEQANSDLNELSDLISLESMPREKIKKSDVYLVTMHSSKGLEFPTVIIAGACSHFLPLAYFNRNWQHLEEERRLFYVSITRAQKLLVISQGGSSPTIFLTYQCRNNLQHVKNIDEIINILNQKEQKDNENYLLHPIFGQGKILKKISSTKLLISFDSGEKIIDLTILNKNN